MKKQQLTKITLTALAASLCAVTTVNAVDQNVSNATQLSAACKGGCGHQQNRTRRDGPIADNDAMKSTTENSSMETDFRSQLDDKSKALFDTLDADGKALAIKMSETTQDKNEAVKKATAIKNQKNSGY